MSVVLPELLDTLQVTMPSLDVITKSASFAIERSDAREALLRTRATDDPVWNERMAAVLLERGDLVESRRYATVAVDLATARADEEALGEALRTLALTQIEFAMFDDARATTIQLDGMGYRRTPRTLARFSEARATWCHRTGNFSNGLFFESESRYRSAILSYAALDDIHGQLRARLGLSRALGALGHYPAAVDEADAALQIVIENEAWRHAPGLLLNRATCIRDTGIHAPTKVLFEESIAWAEELGIIPNLTRAWLCYGMLLGYDVSRTKMGGFEDAEHAFSEGLRLAKQMAARPLIIDNYQWHAVLYEKLEMHEQAAELRKKIAALAQDHEIGPGKTTLDLMDQERAQLQSWRHERFRIRMRETIESTPDALFVLDAVYGSSGRIVDLVNEFRNGAAHELAGCSPTDVLTLTQLEQLPIFAGLRAKITAAIESRSISTDDVWIDGQPKKNMARRVVPVGEGVAITLRDATVEREAATALKEAAEKARRADRAKSEFLANMSHEVRTPINGVLGLARLLADTELDGTQKSYVDGIISSADILLAVIGDVLDLSKIEAARVEIRPEPTALPSLVGSVIALFQGQAKAKHLALTSQIDPKLPRFINVDSSRLQQVLANLVGNAVKFTTHGGVDVNARLSETRLRFEVRDSGPGIEKAELESAFEAFHQASREAQLQGGTGLGLTISRSIIELMGGQIGVSSRVGEGSSFWFELPLVRADAPAIAPSSPAPEGFAGVRILLVEDNAVNVMVATAILRKSGCCVDVASNGVKAIELAATGNYAAVLMDVRMPGMDGLEATRRIRAAEFNGRLPIIALTASALTDDRDECFQAGMDDYLGKPFTAQALKDTLAKWV